MQSTDWQQEPAMPTARGTGGLMQGVRAALRGMGAALGNRDVRRVYLRFTLAMLAMTVLIGGGLIAGVWTLTAASAETGDLATVGLWLLRLAGMLISLLAAPVLALFAIDILFPLLSEMVFFAGMRGLAPRRAEMLEAMPGQPLMASARAAIALFVYFLLLTIAAFLIGLIPVVGPVLGPVAQLWFTAQILGWELTGPYFDKRQMGFRAQRAYVKTWRTAFSGFGLPCSLLLAVPLIGPLFFGLIQAAAPALVIDVLEARDPAGEM